MFSSVSHEFRTPLNAISNSVTLMEFNMKEMNKLVKSISNLSNPVQNKLDKYIESNERFSIMGQISSKILMNLVEDILDLAKIEAGKFDLLISPFYIKGLLEEIKFIFRQQWDQKGLYLKIEWEQRLLETKFNSDISRIRQILLNLISNSFKFTENGGITISVKSFIKHENHESKRNLHFWISDTGVGISAEDRKWLFKMFSVVKKHKEVFNSKGTGLGLTITQKLVNLLGGEIELLSEEGKGTDVNFTISDNQININEEEEEKPSEEFDIPDNSREENRELKTHRSRFWGKSMLMRNPFTV